MTLEIANLPGAHFASNQAVAAHRDTAERYEVAVAAFATDRCEATLWEALRALGYDMAEIEWHARRPGARMMQGYM